MAWLLLVKYCSFFEYVHLLLNVPLVLLPVKAQGSAKSPKDVFSALAQVEQVGT